MSERLQKILARAGLGSRRAIERWIEEGRISINGRTATLGAQATQTDRICLDGRSIPNGQAAPARVLMYHKPEGKIASRVDAQGRSTLYEDLPPLRGARWITVGRLDLNTSGLLLVTTDGALAHHLMHPRYEVEREYMVRVLGEISEPVRARLLAGVALDGRPARFFLLDPQGGAGANRWYRVVIREGRYREVRRLFAAVGLQVSRLMRVRFGPVQLPRNLKPGEWRDLDPRLVRALRSAAQLDGTDP
ncbi:MAG: pseudouridine synthase [Acidiferrobacteraceae bacterium]